MVLLVGASSAAASPAYGVPASTAIARLNAQRVAHGVPGGIVEVPAWSNGCRSHNEYQRLNGGALTHGEDPTRPGFTPEGADAGSRAVLAAKASWAQGNPWETAPIHLHQLLNPRLARAGVHDSAAFSCFTTHGGTDGPAPASLVTYSYPGQGVVHRYEEVASEDPYTPGQLVGLRQGTKTGPYLYVMADAPEGTLGARVVAATLEGPRGPVELRAVDNSTPGLVGFLPTGAQLIPVRPLAPSSTYTANVDLDLTLSTGAVVRVGRRWTFRTRARLPGTLRLVLSGTRIRGRSLRIRVACSGGPCASRIQARWRGGGRSTRRVRLRNGERRTVRLRARADRLSVWIDGRPAATFGHR